MISWISACLFPPFDKKSSFFPSKFRHLGYVHLVYIQLSTSSEMSAVLYTWSNAITIKYDSRSSIVFDSKRGILICNRTVGAPLLSFQTVKKRSSVQNDVLCDWNTLCNGIV